MPIKVVIAGFKGRMGQAAYHMVLEDPELELWISACGWDNWIYNRRNH